MHSKYISDSQIIAASKETNSAAKAAALLKIHFNTYKRRAIQLGCYATNQGNRGVLRPKAEGNGKINLIEILNGFHPQYQTFKLKKRLFAAGIKENCCEICSLKLWQGLSIECELDHIDGDRTNHILSNLRIICPNCHSQTPTFRAKNKK